MAFIDGFMPRDLRLTGVSPTMWRVTAALQPDGGVRAVSPSSCPVHQSVSVVVCHRINTYGGVLGE
jgi:hypothetical protein